MTAFHRRARGFSLVEVLLAVFILGIGIISISALFPAGIAQQRQSVDDIIGPLVANNALAVLRSKLSPEDFGTFEFDFGAAQPAPANLVQGDWPWLRPAYYEGRNAIDIFNGSNSAINESAADPPSPIQSGLPYNTRKYPSATAPTILFYQHERYYPMGAADVQATGPPQYVWDCMFRRFQGRILVAIFVYRAMTPGGGGSFYSLQTNGNTPPLPYRQPLAQAWDANDEVVGMTAPGTLFDPFDLSQAWQAPRQWILDQNNIIHRVLAGRRKSNDGPVELVRRVSAVPNLSVYSFGTLPPPDETMAIEDVVTHVWYIPNEVPISGGAFAGPAETLSLTPVYVTVRDL